jgi:hypothetical protein
MSPVTQYIFDGTKWQNEVRTERSTVSRTGTTRSGLVPGAYKPGPGTAGLLEGVALTPIDTTMTYSQFGTASAPIVVANKQFNNRVSVNGKYIQFKNCWFRGSPTDNKDLVTSTNANIANVLFEDCLFRAQKPQWATAAVRGGHHTTFSRCEFRGCIDGIAHTNSQGYTGDQSLNVYGCWFHDMAYFSPDPGAAGGVYDNASHVDLLQIRGGQNFHFKGNNFDAMLDPAIGQANMPSQDRPEMDANGQPTGKTLHITGNKYYPNMAATSVLMASPKLGELKNVVLENNWINGGSYSLNFGPNTTGTVTIRNNKWGRDMRGGRTATTIAQYEMPLNPTGNTFLDDGSPANMVKRG